MEFDDVDLVDQEQLEQLEAAEAIKLASHLLENGGPRCLGCGCSATRPCPGGCVWATETLCSQCVA